jgi:3-methyladenine DNA glycosylase Tag
MNRLTAVAFFREAKRHALEDDPEMLDWFTSISRRRFRELTPRSFMEEYLWVVYASGFRYKMIRSIFPRLRRAFRNCDYRKIARMRSLTSVHRVFANRRKARFVRDGARLLVRQGFDEFKRHVTHAGPDGLVELPGVGWITKDHLARNIGLASVAKNDRWIARLVKLFRAETHERMAAYLGKRFRMKPGVVDYVLWKFCADRAWENQGAKSLKAFVRGLRRRANGRAKNRLNLTVGPVTGLARAARPVTVPSPC